jgi:membrane protein required for colicin V production
MNWLDIVILAVIAWFTFSAFSAGILRETVTLVATILGVVLAGAFYKELSQDVMLFVDSENTARIIAFIAIFAATFFGGQLAATLLKRTASLLLLGWVDHVGGLVFGFVKGILIVELLLIFFTTYHLRWVTSAIDGSVLAPLFLEGIPILTGILPEEFERAVEGFPG